MKAMRLLVRRYTIKHSSISAVLFSLELNYWSIVHLSAITWDSNLSVFLYRDNNSLRYEKQGLPPNWARIRLSRTEQPLREWFGENSEFHILLTSTDKQTVFGEKFHLDSRKLWYSRKTQGFSCFKGRNELKIWISRFQDMAISMDNMRGIGKNPTSTSTPWSLCDPSHKMRCSLSRWTSVEVYEKYASGHLVMNTCEKRKSRDLSLIFRSVWCELQKQNFMNASVLDEFLDAVSVNTCYLVFFQIAAFEKNCFWMLAF